jgi:hypothetical protein
MRDRTRQCLEDMLEDARTALMYVEEDREGWAHDGLRLDGVMRQDLPNLVRQLDELLS